jgi:hypothetical protein
MKKKIALVFITLLIILSAALTGCSSGSGITQAQLDELTTQKAALQTQLDKAQSDLASTAAEKTAQESALNGQITDLTKQLADLKAQYEYSGLTTAQLAEKLVFNYTATHTYTKTDMFICGDMSSEVWNMLKTQGISAVIAIGNPDASINNILDSVHAWVLADIGGGQKLALETTAGVVMTPAEHPLYYHGWYFNSPTDLKANNDLIKEYNVRVGFRNTLAAEVNSAMTLYNGSTNQADADKYLALYDKLKQLQTDQETLLYALKAQIDQFATRF